MRDPAHALDVPLDDGQVLPDLSRQGLGVRLREEELEARGDDPDGVVDLVSEPGRERAEGGQLFVLVEDLSLAA